MKVCTRCGVAKDPNKDFYMKTQRRRYPMPNSWCKECDKANVRARRHKAMDILRRIERGETVGPQDTRAS